MRTGLIGTVWMIGAGVALLATFVLNNMYQSNLLSKSATFGGWIAAALVFFVGAVAVICEIALRIRQKLELRKAGMGK